MADNLPNNDFINAYYWNTTGKYDIFQRWFTDPMPGYILTAEPITVDLLVQAGFQIGS